MIGLRFLRRGERFRRRVRTGFGGKDEMILSIEICRSGYISARRTSRSVGGAEASG